MSATESPPAGVSAVAASDPIPGRCLVTRSKSGWQAFCVEDAKEDEDSGVSLRAVGGGSHECSSNCDIVWSADGLTMCVCTEAAMQLHCGRTLKPLTSLPQRKVRRVWFSPRGNFVVAFRNKQSATDRNVRVWLWRESRCVLEWTATRISTDNPPFSFTHDDSLFARAVNNGLLIYETDAFKTVAKKEVNKVESVAFAPVGAGKRGKAHGYRLGVFRNKHKGKAAAVEIVDVAFERSKKDGRLTSGAFRAFHSADDCALLWNSKGDCLLALVSSDVDASDSSYYGKQNLYLLNATRRLSATIPVASGGPLQEAKWHPNGCEFLVIDDYPTKVSSFNQKGERITVLVKDQSRNIVRFSHNGALLWLGGFGNLNGEMTFFNYKSKLELKFLGFCKDESCRFYEWSPDANLFVTARIAPFRQVDNGFRLYDYVGNCVFEEEFDRLYQVSFRPFLELADGCGERRRAPSPGRKGKALRRVKDAVRYVPPHLRGKAGASASSSSLSEMAAAKPKAAAGHSAKDRRAPKPKKKKQRPEVAAATGGSEQFWPRGRRHKKRAEARRPPVAAQTEVDVETKEEVVGEAVVVVGEAAAVEDVSGSGKKKRKRKRKRKKKTGAVETDEATDASEETALSTAVVTADADEVPTA